MAPRNTTTGRPTASSSSSADTVSEECTDTSVAVAILQAEVDRLTVLLDAANAAANPLSVEQTMTVLTESIVQALGRSRVSPEPRRTANIPDPLLLSNGLDPTFESWKNQIQAKLAVNADYFADDAAKIAYVFTCMSGNAQKHLNPRIGSNAVDAFRNAATMIEYLSGIYEDPFRIQNARREYRRLTMKLYKAYTDFYTRFLYLAGEGKVPEDDLCPDLYNKLSIELQRAIAPTEASLVTLSDLHRALIYLDQNLQQIQECTNRTRACTTPKESAQVLYRAQKGSTEQARAGTPGILPTTEQTACTTL